jgi:peptidoglycan/xylan/chitin deacetylase (PgdA/CDA1 family)
VTRSFLFTIDADWVPGSDTGLVALLELCESMDLRATIFATGRFGLAYPALIRRAAEAGHEIGVHGWEHPMPAFRRENYRFTPVEERRVWLNRATDALAEITRQTPRSFRAPFLWTDASTFELLEGLGYAVDSSIPARRFDGLLGMVNHFDYFRASLDPYHPDRRDPVKRGDSPILEIPPSAFLIPLNMSTLRFVGLPGTLWLARAVARRSSILNFYCHPWEFVSPGLLEFPPGVPTRHTRAVGPHWLAALGAFVRETQAMGYRSLTAVEVAACGSW